jgi:hypothetical protein
MTVLGSFIDPIARIRVGMIPLNGFDFPNLFEEILKNLRLSDQHDFHPMVRPKGVTRGTSDQRRYAADSGRVRNPAVMQLRIPPSRASAVQSSGTIGSEGNAKRRVSIASPSLGC